MPTNLLTSFRLQSSGFEIETEIFVANNAYLTHEINGEKQIVEMYRTKKNSFEIAFSYKRSFILTRREYEGIGNNNITQY